MKEAERLREVAKENRKNMVDELIEMCEDEAKKGNTRFLYTKHLSDAMLDDLENEGFDVFEDDEGEYTISWAE